MADFLAGARHHLDEEAQVGRSVVTAGLLDQIATQGYAGHERLRDKKKNRAHFSVESAPALHGSGTADPFEAAGGLTVPRAFPARKSKTPGHRWPGVSG
ncbi:hypothetical protein D9M70_631400 [compost metagenome]